MRGRLDLTEAWVAWGACVCTGRSVVPTDGGQGEGSPAALGGPGSAPDLFPPEEGPFVLKPDNGAARRAKPRQNLPHVSRSGDW